MRTYKPSPIETAGADAIIHLNNGGRAVIDRMDFPLVVNLAWRSHPNGNGNHYASTRIAGKTVYLHRRILQPTTGLVVDHIDGDGLNCRRTNMRLCSPTENARNQRAKGGKPKGVHKHDSRELWYAEIRVDGKRARMPYRKTQAEAVADYDSAAVAVYGEYARPNA